MPFVPLAALMFLFGDVFDGHRQLNDQASVPPLTPRAGGGHSPPASVGCTPKARV